MRSKLFVPASKPELFAKALAGPADAISLDLEDSVAAGDKDAARANLAALLAGLAERPTDKAILVRINHPGSPCFAADVEAVAHPAIALVNLPKVESPDDVLTLVGALERVERARGIERPIGVLPTIESAAGLLAAPAIAAAHRRVAGLQLGLADLLQPLGIAREPDTLHAALFTLRIAAAAAGGFAYDAAYPNLADDDGFRAEAERARRLGFLGKSCVHPRQVAIANQVFRPSPAELARARRIVEASRFAGGAVFALDGEMIDAPYLRRAEELVRVGAERP